MKKRALFAMVTGLLCTMFFTGCFGKVINPNHSGKKEIVISLYSGGLGTDWIQPSIDQFEADYPEYKIFLEKKKRTVAEIMDLIAIGNQADAYISTVADFHSEIYKDNLEDIGDILDMKVDGTDKTIGDKFPQKDFWKKISSKDGEGMYMLPYEDGLFGLNYDHSKFLEYGLLIEAENTDTVKAELAAQSIAYTVSGEKLKFESSAGETNYRSGDTILRAGKDGKYGTYDDGQPITMAEWNHMFNLLKGIGEAVIYSGKILDYTTEIFNSAFAQYDGMEGWELFNSYTGSYTFEGDDSATTVKMDTGSRVYGMTGIRKATEFLQTYLNNKEYAHDSCFISEESHTDAQGKFVIGSAKTSTTAPFAGFLADGVWWENEARKVFNDLSTGTRPMKEYEYGTRDYRIMLLPEMPGQKGADGQGNGSVLSARATGAMIVPKNTDADILEKTKMFLSYTLSDENLRHFTATTGVPRPYEYELTAEDKAKMSKYALNNWNLYHDSDNIAIVRPLIDRYVTAIPYKSSKGYNVNWMSKIGAVSYNVPISALRIAETAADEAIQSDPVMAVFKGFEKHFAPAWASYVNEIGK